MKVTVIGAGSFIGQALRRENAARDWRFLGHAQALSDTGWSSDSDVVLNCAFDDRLKREDYRPEWDIDLRLAQLLQVQGHARYVMLSSRTVYGLAPTDERLHEALPTHPQNLYAHAKRHTEEALASLLGDRLTVFRLSNIYGFEPLQGRRNFFAIALNSLREQGLISLDINPFVQRDFLPVEHCAAWLCNVMPRLRGGTFNLGAGFATPVGRIAQWIIEGFGSGRLEVTDFREFDGFWLDMSSARAAFGALDLSPAQVREACNDVGRRLRASVDQLPAATGGIAEGR